MHYYPKNIGDYRRDTMHLSLLEHGVYMTLIDHYILNEEPFSDNIEDILWLVGARTEEEKNAVSLILNKFFKKKDDGYYHKRCDEEIQKYKKNAEVARENGKKGGRPKNPGVTQEKPKPKLTNNQKLETNNHEPLFVEFWKLYPHRNGVGLTKPQSLEWWNKQTLDTLTKVLEGTKRFKLYLEKCHKDKIFSGGIPDPIRYLKNKRYHDEFKVARKKTVYDNIK
jgi:uncharacterized protein YdaU (DUF1376 family)